LNIVIAGASGYIGRALIPILRSRYPEARITALSRSPRTSGDPQIDWRVCDLFSLLEIENSLPDRIDVAYYLVHSMLPTAHLDQGSFADYDLILADNFARALKLKNGKRLIYLSGLISDVDHLSPHLRSRREVEQIFKAHKLDTTTFRAGLVVGPHGSSFEILVRLVKRLPVMLCPTWTQTLTTPIDLLSVVSILARSATAPSDIGRTYDLAGSQPLTYMDMMMETARWLGLKRRLFRVPFFTPWLSRLWVSLITGQSKALLYPLIESLRFDMVPRVGHLYDPPPTKSYGDILREMPKIPQENSHSTAYTPKKLRVRSVQRLPLPKGMSAKDVREEYVRWLPGFFRPFIRVWCEGDHVAFSLISKRFTLLSLHFSAERSTLDRQLLYIEGGLLAGKESRGRFEFREVLNGRFILAAIHEYNPALPWYIYQWTQAKAHLFVMKAFGRHLTSRDAI